ncbi:phage conserved hypothetical protein, phiE125 gp8 family [Sphingomonas palmae]|uniref:Phage gp6-like head-tail connector protein n=1 Tax=Sphingomonas palmae TaxID=1855283 RepID=A0A1H7MR65_9SPHN|nr:hypothetical protein [Sphingomonas palmae]SEL13703.1 phage conserved hypothetical protein, phiE125 gp8 family [Sphingomonas palmae]
MTVTNGPGAVALGGEDRASAVAAIKAQLRVASGDEDALIAGYAEAALGVAEQFLAQVLIAREASVVLVEAGAAWQLLPVAPVSAITAVVAAGTALPIADYAVDVDAEARGWVRTARRASVTVRAGLASDWAGLPAAVRQGVVMLAAHLFEHRGGEASVPAAVTALWRPFRRLALTRAVHA